MTTLVSLGALKNRKCIPENFPLPSMGSALSLTKRDEENYEEEDVKEVKPRHNALPEVVTNGEKYNIWIEKDAGLLQITERVRVVSEAINMRK